MVYLPPETIDNILHHLAEPVVFPYHVPCALPPCDAHEKIASQFRDDLRNAALVARDWRFPAHRLLFRNVKIEGWSQAQRAVDAWAGNAVLGSCVRELNLIFGVNKFQYSTPTKKECVDQGFVSEEQFVQIFSTTTQLTSLRLETPSFDHLGAFSTTSLAHSNRWGMVTKLTIFTAAFDYSGRLMRQLLNMTPNVEQLDLGTTCITYNSHVKNWAASESSAASLPRLRSLTIRGELLARELCDIRLLTNATLQRIESYGFSLYAYVDYAPVFEVIGASLKELVLYGRMYTNVRLRLCPNLEHLVMATRIPYYTTAQNILLSKSLKKVTMLCEAQHHSAHTALLGDLIDQSALHPNFEELHYVFLPLSSNGEAVNHQIAEIYVDGRWISKNLQAKVDKTSLKVLVFNHETGLQI